MRGPDPRRRRFTRLRAMERPIMQSSNWAPEHCQALREYRARGMSYGQIAQALNAKFGTTYTRNAALGRGVRRAPELRTEGQARKAISGHQAAETAGNADRNGAAPARRA